MLEFILLFFGFFHAITDCFRCQVTEWCDTGDENTATPFLNENIKWKLEFIVCVLVSTEKKVFNI